MPNMKKTLLIAGVTLFAGIFLGLIVHPGINMAARESVANAQQLLNSPVGDGMSVLVLLLGGALGLAKNSTVPIWASIATAFFVAWGTDVAMFVLQLGPIN